MAARIKIPPGWDKVALGDVLDQRSELIQPEGNGNTRFVGLEHIGSGDPALYSWASDTDVKSTKFRFYDGDLLYGKLRPYLDKAVEASFEGICSTDILALIPKIERESTKYLLYTIHSRPFIQHAISHTSGTNHPRTSWKAISQYEFPLPPKKERQKIGIVLSTVDSAIQKSKVAAEETELLKQGVMQELLTKGIGHTNFRIDSRLSRVPSVWETGTFSDIADVNPKTDTSHLSDDSCVTFLPMPNVGEDGHIVRKETKHYSEVRNGYTTFIENDVLFAKITPCMENGKGALATDLVNGVGFGSTEFHVLRAKSHSDPNFIFHLSRYRVFRSAAERFMTGSAGQQRVSARVFELYPIPVIPHKEQVSIATILSTIDRKLDLQRQRTTALEQLKQGLMNDLLTGKRRVVA